MMRYIRNSERPNFIVGIFLLVMLAMFAGPNILPRLFATVFPGFDEAIPCAWLREASNRADHQSLLGRAADSPIALNVRTSGISNDPAEFLTIVVVVTNQSLGTVPFLFNPDQVMLSDNNTSGVGVIFNPPAQTLTGPIRAPDPTTFSEENIRLLGPQQSCVFRLEIANGNVLIDPSISSGTARVSAYYRINSAGQVLPTPGDLTTPIYPDQGLWTGYVTSDAVTIPRASQ
jgi:hypothetical protein